MIHVSPPLFSAGARGVSATSGLAVANGESASSTPSPKVPALQVLFESNEPLPLPKLTALNPLDPPPPPRCNSSAAKSPRVRRMRPVELADLVEFPVLGRECALKVDGIESEESAVPRRLFAHDGVRWRCFEGRLVLVVVVAGLVNVEARGESNMPVTSAVAAVVVVVEELFECAVSA